VLARLLGGRHGVVDGDAEWAGRGARGERGKPGSSSRCTAARNERDETVTGHQLRSWSNTYSARGAGGSSQRGHGFGQRVPQRGGARAGQFGRGGGLTQVRRQRVD